MAESCDSQWRRQRLFSTLTKSMPTAVASAVFSPTDGCNLPVAANCLLLEAAVKAGVGSASSILPTRLQRSYKRMSRRLICQEGRCLLADGSTLNTFSNRLPSWNQFV